jgi:hypothetical protein
VRSVPYLLSVTDFGEHSVVLGVLLVLLARVLGTGVFLMHIDTAGRRTLLLGGKSAVANPVACFVAVSMRPSLGTVHRTS